ncbi:MAG: hypothetical protein Q4F79_00455 [Eubacteriales bacterium]|nr:hypothetical protein [Eubacteriales bacterium]
MNEVQKPITVARAEFISGMTSIINNSMLPPFIIEPILKDMLNDVRIMAQRQLEQDTKRYHDALEALEQDEPQCGD